MRIIRAFVSGVGEILISIGMVLLLFVAWQLWWTDIVAAKDQHEAVTKLERALSEPKTTVDAPDGKAFAIMRVPRFGAEWVQPIYEGTDTDTLQRGVGHYKGTGNPADIGNFSIAGHRTTYGRPFHNIELLQNGDAIVIRTSVGYTVYRVTSHEIVPPTDGDVIAPVAGQPDAKPTEKMMTMTACHPKYSAQERYVVHAKLDKTYTAAEGLPASVLAPPTGQVG